MIAILPMLPRMATVFAAAVLFAAPAHAHGISESSRETMTAGTTVDYIWLGAEHMVTGYDHLLFLFGVLFFLSGFRDILRFITAFTIGHCITLLGATLAGISANAYIIDAVIALSVIYKGFENLDGFPKLLKMKAPNLLGMVFIFGLIHGFGLSTRLQEITLGSEGLITKILAFNVGVEVGQVAALAVMLTLFSLGRSGSILTRISTVANGGLMLAGLGLFAMQVDGFMHEDHHHTGSESAEAATPSVNGEHAHGSGHHTHAEEKPTAAPHAQDAIDGERAPEATNAPDETSAPQQGDPAEQAHGHGHGHGHGHSHKHSHDKTSKPDPSTDDSSADPKPTKTHTHGSGAPHRH